MTSILFHLTFNFILEILAR